MKLTTHLHQVPRSTSMAELYVHSPIRLHGLGHDGKLVKPRDNFTFLLSLCNFLQPYVTFSLLGPNILHSTLFSNTLSLCSSHNLRDHASHSTKLQAKDSELKDDKHSVNLMCSYFFMNIILICQCHCQIFELHQIFRGSLALFGLHLMMRYDHTHSLLPLKWRQHIPLKCGGFL
jgi:hypothetical protein